MATVFYSWQSDLPGNTNRGFIETALKKALADLEEDPAVQDSPRLDKDTQGVPGSPDIVNEILAKIRAAEVCVFDISIVAKNDVRKLPNPNVMIELGYALRHHPFQKIIMVFNTATGDTKELPFDLGFKRALTYHAEEGEEIDRSKERAELAGKLTAQLKLVFAHNEANRFTPAEIEFFSAVYDNARVFLNLRAEMEDRSLNPHAKWLREESGTIGDSLRNLATEDAAQQHPRIVEDLKTCADKLDKVKAWLPLIGARAHQEFVASMDEAAEAARTLLEKATPAVRQKLAKVDTSSEKRKLARLARSQFDRLKTAVEQKDSTHFAAIREALEGTGISMLKLAAALEVLGDADAGDFRTAAHALHIAAIVKSQEIGFREIQALVARLDPVLKPLARFG
jgi:hypothetical protein